GAPGVAPDPLRVRRGGGRGVPEHRPGADPLVPPRAARAGPGRHLDHGPARRRTGPPADGPDRLGPGLATDVPRLRRLGPRLRPRVLVLVPRRPRRAPRRRARGTRLDPLLVPGGGLEDARARAGGPLASHPDQPLRPGVGRGDILVGVRLVLLRHLAADLPRERARPVAELGLLALQPAAAVRGVRVWARWLGQRPPDRPPRGPAPGAAGRRDRGDAARGPLLPARHPGRQPGRGGRADVAG